ncbi:MAG: thioredoxin-like domain-containing protein [Bacteroidota bacterium]
MNKLLYGLKAAWKAELLKLKGSRIILMTCILGLFLPVLYNFISVMAKYFADVTNFKEKLPYNIILENIKSPLIVFGSFFFPLTLILVTSRLATLEHKSDTWKLVETQPVSRFSFWIVKWLMAACMSMLAILVYFLSSLIFTYILFYFDLYDKYAFVKLPFQFMASAGIRIWLSSLGIITLQLTISMLIRSTIWPIVVGVILLLLTNITIAMQSALLNIWPYALPYSSSLFPDGSEVGNWLLPPEKQGMIWLLFIPFAFLFYRYRNSFRLSFRNKGLWVVATISLVVLGLATWWLQQPKILPIQPGKIVIAGIIKADRLPDSLELEKVPIGTEKDKVNHDGSFKFTIRQSAAVAIFSLRIARGLPDQTIYAGDGDSIFVDWTQGKSPELRKINLRGTAIATNAYFLSSRSMIDEIRYYMGFTEADFSSSWFYSQLMRGWENDINQIKKFKTADGIGLSKTVSEMREKVITAGYLSVALYEYPEKKNIDLKSAEFDKIRKNLEPLQKKLQPFEQGLVGWKAYNNYLYFQITRSTPEGLNADSVFYATIMQKPPGAMRDAILFDFAKKRIGVARDSATRASIMRDMVSINDKDMQQELLREVDVLNRMRKGKTAPAVAMHNDKMEPVHFSMLKGKYVVIDLWATWCTPCLDIAPTFERMSEKYRNSPVVFLSLSIDHDLTAWQQHIKRKKNKVINWRVFYKIDFYNLYGVESIPHFILLDPEGNFINANFPRPDEGNFEIQLRQALKLPAEEG